MLPEVHKLKYSTRLAEMFHHFTHDSLLDIKMFYFNSFFLLLSICGILPDSCFSINYNIPTSIVNRHILSN